MDSYRDERGVLGGAGVGQHLLAQISLTFLAFVAVRLYRHLFITQKQLPAKLEKSAIRVFSQQSVIMPMPGSCELLPTVAADERLSVGPARSEYRAILENEGYQDLCGTDEYVDGDIAEVREYTKPPKVKHATQWSASLESITEEDERGGDSDSTSPETYATYINNVNESPRIYHAGRVWCITKRVREEDQPQQHHSDSKYLETDIDNVDEIGYERYQYRHDISREEGSDVPALNPTYILQETAVPVAYPGHSQYISKDSNDNSVDRPNFITTESGDAEWTYSFPIATDAFAMALDQESNVTSTNTYVRPVASVSTQGKHPIIDNLNPSAAVNLESENLKKYPSQVLSETPELSLPSVPQRADTYNQTENGTWVETISSPLIIPTPELSPTIHRQDIPMEIDILDSKQTMNLNIDEDSRQNVQGLLETDIDMPAAELEKVELLTSSEKKDDTQINDKDKGQKSKKFIDKFRRNNKKSGTKNKHKGIKNARNSIKRSKFRNDLSDRRNDERLLDDESDIEIDDDDDLRTINGSGPEGDDTEEFKTDDVSPGVGDDEVTPHIANQNTENDFSVINTDNDSNVSNPGKATGVRLLCCHAPRLEPNEDSPYAPSTNKLYLISAEDDQFHGRRRASTDTVQTEVVFSSDDDEETATQNPAALDNGSEVKPGRPLIDPLTSEDQKVSTFDPEEIDNIEIRSSIRICAYASPDLLDKNNKHDNLEVREANTSISAKKNELDNMVSTNELNSSENFNILEPKGYASTTAQAFYLIGTPPQGNAGVTESIRLRPDQASCSDDDMFQNKQSQNNLDKEHITPLSYTNKDKTPLLTHNPSALRRKDIDEEITISTAKDIKKLDTTLTASNLKSSNYKDDIQTVSSAGNLSGNLTPERLTSAEREKGDRIQELLEEWRHDVTVEADDAKADADDQQIPDLISKQSEQIVKQSSAKLTNVAFGPVLNDEDSRSIVNKKQNCLQLENDKWEQNSTTSAASDASERASAVITEQRARIRDSLKKLNLPDWYKNSKHHKKILNNEQKVDYPDYVSEPRFGRSWSRSSVGGSDWSMDSSGSSCGAATKLSFLSEARYRRAYHNYDRYYHHRPSTQMPIRTAFSWAELPRRETLEDDETDIPPDPEVAEKYHSSDALLSINEPPAVVIQSGSPLHASSPNLSPSRSRSRSTGESDNFNALSIRRLEHKTSDAVFYITGQSDSSVSPIELPSPGDDSGFNDSFESKSSRYEIKEAIIRPTISVKTKQSKPEDNNKPLHGQTVHETPVSSPPMKPPRLLVSENTHSSPAISDSSIDSNNTKPNSYQFKPITLAEDEVSEYYREWPDDNDSSTSATRADSQHSTPWSVRPDPRYNSDGSRNDKVSPFPMLTQSSDELSSREESPRSRSKKCNVRITITDTSMSDYNYNVLDPTTLPPRPKSPIDFDEMRASEFAAVLSVVTSSNIPDAPQNTRKKDIPPPPEVSMEEIVDSLLGLSSFSNADLTTAGSVPELNLSSISEHSQQQTITNHNRTSNLDSLFSDEGMHPLHSIIVKNSGEGDAISTSSSIQSTPRSARDIVEDEIFMVKCSFRKCAKVKELEEARETYKTCHNCYTYYCSRECRSAHWERHKKKCLFSRINSAAKHVIYNSRYNEELQDDLSRIARTGYLSRGRGAILLIFPDIDTAENYMTYGIEGLHYPPTYSTIKDLENCGLFADHLPFLIEMCRSYDPDVKFVLNVAIMTSDETASKPLPRKHVSSVKKCAKVRLSMLHTRPRQLPSNERETLILTAPSGVSSEGVLDKKSRQICFIHIQRQLRQRGVNLRHQHSEIYDQLCHWVEYHDHFTPVTIYPRENGTGPRFMCVIMPDSDPNDFGWTNNPQLLDSIDLDAELEKLENVVSNVAADKL